MQDGCISGECFGLTPVIVGRPWSVARGRWLVVGGRSLVGDAQHVVSVLDDHLGPDMVVVVSFMQMAGFGG